MDAKCFVTAQERTHSRKGNNSRRIIKKTETLISFCQRVGAPGFQEPSSFSALKKKEKKQEKEEENEKKDERDYAELRPGIERGASSVALRTPYIYIHTHTHTHICMYSSLSVFFVLCFNCSGGMNVCV